MCKGMQNQHGAGVNWVHRVNGCTHPNSKNTSRLLLCPETWACLLNAWKRKSTCTQRSRAELLQQAGAKTTGSICGVIFQACSRQSPLSIALGTLVHGLNPKPSMSNQGKMLGGAHILFIVSVSKDPFIEWGIIIDGPLPSDCSYSMSRGEAPCCTRTRLTFDYALMFQV